jgi:hypothetical protein
MIKRAKISRGPKQHSYSDYRRLSPEENERQGFSRKARHYVLKIVKRVTGRTPSITARAHETLRTHQLHGLASPDRRLIKKVRERVGEYLPTSNPRRKRARFHFTAERMKNFERNRERRLRGEWLDNGEWFEMMDTARALKDHRILQLRASPAPAAFEVGR